MASSGCNPLACAVTLAPVLRVADAAAQHPANVHEPQRELSFACSEKNWSFQPVNGTDTLLIVTQLAPCATYFRFEPSAPKGLEVRTWKPCWKWAEPLELDRSDRRSLSCCASFRNAEMLTCWAA